MLVCDCHFLFLFFGDKFYLENFHSLLFIHSFIRSFYVHSFIHSFIQFIYCFRIMEAVATELTAGSWDRISGGASVDRSMSVTDSLASVISQR